MTIAACLYHGEVIFPNREEIIDKRYVKRRYRRPPIVDMTMPNAITYQYPKILITFVSRPCLFVTFDQWCGLDIYQMRDHVRRMILDRPENKVRAMLHKLEDERRKCASEYSEAENKLAEFRRDDSNGYLAAQGWTVLGIIAKIEELRNAVSEARHRFECAYGELERFKKDVLWTIWPISRKGTAK